MCHGYELSWYQRENAAKRKAKADSEVVRAAAARRKETARAVSEDKVEEKELVPAE